MKLPAIVVNFKTYKNATGAGAVALAKIHEKVARVTGATIAVAVQAVDLAPVIGAVSIPVFAQHFDVADEGPYTGHVTPHSLKALGAYGSLLNHAEKKLPVEVLEKSIELARSLDLFTIACAETAYAGNAIAELDPDLVAVEPPELIGGNVSVTTGNPQIIIDAVQMIGAGRVLVGAGIKTADDIRAAIQFGASGVLVASGVIKSPDPEKALFDLVGGLGL